MIKKYISAYYRWKAIRQLRSRYAFEQEVNKLMEEYDTWKLLQGDLNEDGVARGRASLSEIQAKIRETDKFKTFLSLQ
jgi:hypothetical protein